MRLLALGMLVIPLAAMVAGFAIAVRAALRAGSARSDALTAAGRPVLRSEPRAFLRSFVDAPAVPGPGTLVLSDRDLVFERFFPRRDVSVDLARIVEVRDGGRGRRGDVLVVEWAPEQRSRERGLVLEVRDGEGWAEAIRRAAAARRPAHASPAPAPRPGGR